MAHRPVPSDKNRFPRGNVAHNLITTGFEHEGLARHNPFIAHQARLALAQNQRPNPKGIPKSQHSATGYHRNGCVGTLHPLVQCPHRSKSVIGAKSLCGTSALQFAGENIDQEFGVRGCVEVATIFFV